MAEATLRELPEGASADEALDAFLSYVTAKELSLYPAQEEAILELYAGKNVVLNTPTGSGKSLVAEALHYWALVRGERCVYTSPVKALANEKFFDLVRIFGSERVGLMTGDATVNRDAPIVCATAEVLASMAVSEGARADVDHCVLDEFHYYADRDRGIAWQLPLLELRSARFLLMSATLGDPSLFAERLTGLNGRETAIVRGTERPVPLHYTYAESPLHETVAKLVEKDKAPVYLVNFTQRACAEEAQNLMSQDYCTKEEKRAIHEALSGARFDSPYGKTLLRFLRHGIGLHHAGLLPKYRLTVEKLAQRGLLKIISGTDTLGVGVNVPIRTVLLTRLCKFDGTGTAILSVRDFHQISGRAGRRGFDAEGFVVAQAPEHVIANLRLEAKAGDDPKKLRRIVRRKPPDRGYVPWDKKTFEKLQVSEPEALVSRFSLSHGLVVRVLSREYEGGCLGLGRLVRKCHERTPQKKLLAKEAQQMVASLVEANILAEERDDEDRRSIVVHADLGEDFTLNHALSLYMLDTLKELDEASPTYALDVLTLAESILENPTVVLMRQLDKLKGEKVAELKAAGVEYEERMAELDKLDYPKPNRDFIYDTFNLFAAAHPWVRTDNIRPKSVGRDMVEQAMSFSEYVKEYGLERSEGLLLRYLSEVYKTLLQGVAAWAKTEEVEDLVTFFGAVVRQADSSLLDEWERLKNPEERVAPRPEATDLLPVGSRKVTQDIKAFTVLVRNEVFAIVRAMARRDFAELGRLVAPGAPDLDEGPMSSLSAVEAREALRLEGELAPLFEAHPRLRTDPEARSPKLLTLDTSTEGLWRGRQVLLDDEGDADFYFDLRVDLERSARDGRAVLWLERIAS